jgi:hypothetical protein
MSIYLSLQWYITSPYHRRWQRLNLPVLSELHGYVLPAETVRIRPCQMLSTIKKVSGRKWFRSVSTQVWVPKGVTRYSRYTNCTSEQKPVMTHVTLSWILSTLVGPKSEWSPAQRCSQPQAKYPAISEVEEVRFAAQWIHWNPNVSGG